MAEASSTTQTAAQEEFNRLFNQKLSLDRHPEDEREAKEEEEADEQTEEERYNAQRIDETMRMPVFDRAGTYHLPHSSFDLGRTTGVKGVIADARSFDQAKKQAGWKPSSNTIGGKAVGSTPIIQKKQSDDEDSSEDEEFLERWREERRMQMQREGSDIRNRRTSPSMRLFGRFDEVDAMGYLDAIEKVGRETVVCVFVYDHECAVSQVIEEALTPLVAAYPSVHFVKVHYEEIEFDNAGVPAILAYKNQGDLFANLTYIIDQIPDDTFFDTDALKTVLQKHSVL